MQSLLLARETGDIPPRTIPQTFHAQLLRSFAPAPQHRFNGERAGPKSSASSVVDDRPHNIRAHTTGVSSLALEKFDGRVLISGGADGALKLWDLDSGPGPHDAHTFRPVSVIARSVGGERTKGDGHSHGITHLGFYPFDPDAFLSSSYDRTLKLWSTQRATVQASFDLNATIYSHSTSPVADHLLVACATQHSHVRLVDLKSGSAVQGLAADGGQVLSTAWSPRHDHVLISGHADGKVRVWDVRRASAAVALLDQDDPVGVVDRYRSAVEEGLDAVQALRSQPSAQAHDDAVNDLAFTDDGKYIVSAGMDNRVRVWDADTGANTHASFGSMIQNTHVKTPHMIVTPPGLASHGEFLFWANDQEILVLNLHEGTLITRLRSPGVTNLIGARGSEMGRNRISSIAWRGSGGGKTVGPAMGGGNDLGAVYSAHLDGRIRCWMPQVPGDDDVDDEDKANEDEESKKRKRKVIDDAYRSLMGKQITFT